LENFDSLLIFKSEEETESLNQISEI